MKSSVIRQRVADFFRRHHPFDEFAEEDLLELAGSGRVKFHEAGEVLFRQGENAKGEFLSLIQQGRVELIESDAATGDETLRDVLSDGDLLGLDRFSGDGTFQREARTASDVILYSFSAALLESYALRYRALRRFLEASVSVISGGSDRTSWLDADAPPLPYLQARHTAVAAQVNGHRRPPIAAAVLTTREAVRAMLRERTRQLAVVSGETTEAILTETDLGMFCGHQPVLLIESIREAASIDELKPLVGLASRMVSSALAQPRDVDDCSRLGVQATIAAAEACIRMAGRELAAAGIGPTVAGVPHCWIRFGASARDEVLLPEAPAIAVVYDDQTAPVPPDTAIYFTALAGEAAAFLHRCGLTGAASCWADGSQPAMPLSEWKRFYSDTVADPVRHQLYERREYFDLAPLTGEARIFDDLGTHIRHELRDHPATLALLANDTRAHLPPVTLFRGLVLDLEAGHTAPLDIVETVLAPVVDAARVFALAHQQLDPANTLERLAAAAEADLAPPTVRETADAFRAGLYYRAIAGGRSVNPASLGKLDQTMLKSAFTSIQRFVEHTVAQFFRAAV